MESKTPTPRTDAVVIDLPAVDSMGALIMALTHARDLERELSAARRDAERWKWLMAHGTNWQVTIDNNTYTGNRNWTDAQWAVDAAIAKGGK